MPPVQTRFLWLPALHDLSTWQDEGWPVWFVSFKDEQIGQHLAYNLPPIPTYRELAVVLTVTSPAARHQWGYGGGLFGESVPFAPAHLRTAAVSGVDEYHVCGADVSRPFGDWLRATYAAQVPTEGHFGTGGQTRKPRRRK